MDVAPHSEEPNSNNEGRQLLKLCFPNRLRSGTMLEACSRSAAGVKCWCKGWTLDETRSMRVITCLASVLATPEAWLDVSAAMPRGEVRMARARLLAGVDLRKLGFGRAPVPFATEPDLRSVAGKAGPRRAGSGPQDSAPPRQRVPAPMPVEVQTGQGRPRRNVERTRPGTSLSPFRPHDHLRTHLLSQRSCPPQQKHSLRESNNWSTTTFCGAERCRSVFARSAKSRSERRHSFRKKQRFNLVLRAEFAR